MFADIFAAGVTGLVIIHGLIHLIGFRVYAQEAQVSDVPFKRSFLTVRWISAFPVPGSMVTSG